MKKEDEFECALLNSLVLCFKFCRFVDFPQISKWNLQKNFLACIFTIRLFGDAQEIYLTASNRLEKGGKIGRDSRLY